MKLLNLRLLPSWQHMMDDEQLLVGSLAGAAHLLNNNTGVQRQTQVGQKPTVANKVKSLLDYYFQYK